LLEQQNYKDEILTLQTSLKNQKTRCEDAEETIKTLERRRADDAKVIKQLETTICEINNDLER
jgi:chromosome segregation ATPase